MRLRTTLSRSKSVFYGLLVLGSMLPDIIDKPVGMWLWHDAITNGRIFSHTLILSLIILAAGVGWRLKARKNWGLALASGWLMHLILDQMWVEPRTLLWPLYGWHFERVPVYSPTGLLKCSTM